MSHLLPTQLTTPGVYTPGVVSPPDPTVIVIVGVLSDWKTSERVCVVQKNRKTNFLGFQFEFYHKLRSRTGEDSDNQVFVLVVYYESMKRKLI
jgi:hypothetical protein